MKISQLEQILVIEQVGSINLAAEQLFISQSLLSSSLKALEKELGCEIFLRSNKGVTLTPFGEEFLPYASSVIDQINQMKKLGHSSGTRTLKLNIANNGFRFVSDIIADLYNKNSFMEVSIESSDCPGTKPIEMVSERISEIGVIRIWNFQKSILLKQMKTKDIEFYPLGTMPLAVVVGKKNPLFHQEADSVAIDQLASYSPIRMNYMRLNPVSSIYEKFPHLNTRSSIYVSSRATLYEVLPKTNNYTITAAAIEPYKKSSYYPGTRILKLEGYNYWAQVGWIKHKSTILSPLAQDFIQLLSDYFQ